MLTAAAIKARARQLGFDACGIAPADRVPELEFFREWLAQGYAGEMQYLARTAARRADVRAVLPSARSVIALATVYNVDRPYSLDCDDPGVASIARYAWGDDYHEVIAARMAALMAWMREEAGVPFEARAYVDTGPVQERVWAHYAGLGWIGKNTCLIHPELGSWLFLSEILCSLPLEPDEPLFDHCGTCQLCLEACPTGALVAPHVLDARRCLSYLTIELRGPIPETERAALGTHLFGCDICQEVCPWNAHPPRSTDPAWQPRAVFDRPRLATLWRQSDEAWRRALKASALRRAGLGGIRRNLAVAIGNSGDPEALAALDETPDDRPSCAEPVVAEHVAWARRTAARDALGTKRPGGAPQVLEPRRP
jgi:epoxyqueuosine reductase